LLAGIRSQLSYANVMASIAVFIALGGGAYALSRGEVESRHIAPDAVKAKHIDFGVRSQVMLATFSELGAGTDSVNRAPVGASDNGTVNETFTPQTFFATGLRVNNSVPLPAGTREFTLRYYDYDADEHVVTDLSCEIAVGEQRCESNASVRIPAESTLWFQEAHAGTSGTDYAEVGWRAVLP
jgi:hypothetical protein